MKLYNTLSQKLEELGNDEIKLYVCGITPYDTTHIGHAFLYTQVDALVRYLRYKRQGVRYVQNVTDIDDDILKKAKQEKTDWKELGDYWTKKYLSDMKRLNNLPPKLVRATDSIPTMIKMIHKLLEKHAYRAGGNIYFAVESFPKYGELSKYPIEEMIKLSVERGGDPNDPNKKNPLDFILWQRSRKDEPSWDAPFGVGRPGWHIECSSMIHQYLGDMIDIHGGGGDLVYPHHESEIAQSQSFSGKSPFVKCWMHSGMVFYQGEKMSKSLGNLVMVGDLLKKHSADSIRYLLLSHYYRKEWNFTQDELKRGINPSKANRRAFEEAMENDLNIPEALQYAGPEELEILGFTLSD